MIVEFLDSLLFASTSGDQLIECILLQIIRRGCHSCVSYTRILLAHCTCFAMTTLRCHLKMVMLNRYELRIDLEQINNEIFQKLNLFGREGIPDSCMFLITLSYQMLN